LVEQPALVEGPFLMEERNLINSLGEMLSFYFDRREGEQALRRLTANLAQKSSELEFARDQAVATTHHKSQFLASVSHELRTPLNAILGFSEVLAEKMFGELNQKQEEYIQDIRDSGTHLLSLINDILDLSKIESGRMELELTTFNLRVVLEKVLKLVEEQAQRQSIDISLEVDDRLGDITADEQKIMQVLLNLYSNSIKFTPDGGKVRIRAGIAEDHVKVSVTDTGIGITPENKKGIFEEFKKIRDRKTSDQREIGLGLALAKRFVELHGGWLGVESTVGCGSTFTFMLPH
jgi:signal transduction histidine kinase